jgi:ABC-type lipoprotein release transport system permease subunit
MLPLPLANIVHHPVRSALSALGVAIAVCMLVTLSGLTRGSLEEVAQRWEAVDADLFVYPARWGDNITTISGGGLADADVQAVRQTTVAGKPAVDFAVPVFIYRMKIGSQEHNVIGVSPFELERMLGGHPIQSGGRKFDPDNAFGKWIGQQLVAPSPPAGTEPTEKPAAPVASAAGGPSAVPEQALDLTGELDRHGGLEMVIDTRLARAAKLSVGSKVHAAGQEFTVVGIVQEGGLARAFIPLATAEYLFNGRLGRFTLMFVKLAPGVSPGAACEAIRATKRLAAGTLREYRAMLQSTVGVMYVYVDAVNGVTLAVAFLFILVTLYTAVLQRVREIAILRSLGASRGSLLRMVLVESALLTGGGAVVGAALSIPAAMGIEALAPLLTVQLSWHWVGVAAAAAAAGSMLAGLYPAWHAMRIDVAEALSPE